MRQVVLTAVWLAVALVIPAPVLAHHSFAAYESTQTRTLRGTVETFQWSNPHVAFKMRVEPDGGGEPQEWSIETSGPAILTRFGWTRSSTKAGRPHQCHLQSAERWLAWRPAAYGRRARHWPDIEDEALRRRQARPQVTVNTLSCLDSAVDGEDLAQAVRLRSRP